MAVRMFPELVFAYRPERVFVSTGICNCIVCENWEGTHNVLRTQILKDIFKYDVDQIYLSFMRVQFEKLKNHSKHIQPLITQLHELEINLSKCRRLDVTFQILQIRFIVDSMAQLYCALMLLIEALDQEQSMLSSSKLDCYHYFCLIHLEKKEINYDYNYLQIINRIVSPS